MKSDSLLPEETAVGETNEQVLRRASRIVEQSKQLAALNAIASSVSQSLDLHHILRSAVEQVPRLMEFEAGLIFLTDKLSGELTLSAHQGLSPELVNSVSRLGPEEEFIDSVVRTGEPLIGEIPREGSDKLSRHLRREGFWFFVAIPLKAKGTTLGVLLLASHGPRHVDPSSGQFLLSVGDVVGVAIENATLYRDIAELLEETRRQAERLRESERQFRAVVENATDAVAIIQDYRFRYINGYGLDLLGYSAAEIRDLHFLEIVHPDYREMVARDYLKRLQGEMIPPYDIIMVRKDGAELPVSLNGCLIKYEQWPAVLIIARDMTEPRLLREQILQSEKMAALGRLISGIAHELNNPLTAVIGYTELMRLEEEFPESLRADLDIIYQAADRARRIIQNLLTFARQRRGDKSLVNVNEVLERTLALRAYELRVSNIDLVKELDPNLPPTVADPYQLQQVFLNLIINAEQAMLEARGRGRLIVQTRLVARRLPLVSREKALPSDQRPVISDCIEIVFADDGPGIPAANLNRIFDPFFTTKPIGQGTGLGLSISHSIIESHGGRIYARSQPGGGAAFVIELPIVRQPEVGESTSTGPPPPKITGKSVLVIDDEPTIVSLLGKIVGAEGHRVDTAANGAQALAKLTQHPYDLIFCDIKMPDLDGKEFYRAIRQRDEELARKIVFVTGDLSEETRRFLEQTRSRYIEKPFITADVIRLIRSFLADQS